MFQIRRQRYLLARVRKEQGMMRQPDINNIRTPLSPARAKETRRENKHDRSFMKAGAMTEGLSGRGRDHTETYYQSVGFKAETWKKEPACCFISFLCLPLAKPYWKPLNKGPWVLWSRVIILSCHNSGHLCAESGSRCQGKWSIISIGINMIEYLL